MSFVRTPCRLDKLLSHTTGGSTTGYTYDAAGRPTLVGASRLHYWTYEGEMSSLWNAGAPGYKDSFAYNGLSTRVSKTEQARLMPPTPGTTTAFMRDGAGVTAPVIADTFATYTPGVSERRGGVSTFQHSGIKNHEAQSGSAQTISATREYDAFGNVASSSGTWGGPFGYGGPYGYQESAFHPYKLLGHRYYDPTTGRFLTRDRAKDGRNWYAYCDNNPLTRYDDGGEFAAALVLGAGAGAATAAAPAIVIGAIVVGVVGGIVYVVVKAVEAADTYLEAHRKKARPSTGQKHEEGEAREQQDKGGEKGDARRQFRPPRRQRPPKPESKPPEDWFKPKPDSGVVPPWARGRGRNPLMEMFR